MENEEFLDDKIREIEEEAIQEMLLLMRDNAPANET